MEKASQLLWGLLMCDTQKGLSRKQYLKDLRRAKRLHGGLNKAIRTNNWKKIFRFQWLIWADLEAKGVSTCPEPKEGVWMHCSL